MVKDNKNEEPRPRRGRRARTPEEQLRVFAYKALEELAAKDPSVRDLVIAKECGVDINLIDRHQALKQELDGVVTKLAIQKIQEDEDLRDTLVRAKVFEIMNMKDPELEPKPPPPDPMGELLKKLKQVKEIDDLMKGPKPSFWEEAVKSVSDPKVVLPLLKLLNEILSNRRGGQASESAEILYPIDIDGEVVLLNHDAYEACIKYNVGKAVVVSTTAPPPPANSGQAVTPGLAVGQVPPQQNVVEPAEPPVPPSNDTMEKKPGRRQRQN